MTDKKLDKCIEKIKRVKDATLSEGEKFYFRCLDGSSTKDYPEKESQEAVIRSILKGEKTLAILPPGRGKSLCFQGVAMVSPGTTIVISPLRALISDQVKSFNETYGGKKVSDILGFKIRAIAPGDVSLLPERDGSAGKTVKGTEDSRKGFFHEIVRGEFTYKLIYLTPEYFAKPKFMREFRKYISSGQIKISNVVVDEAHCISQWGFEFRESYLLLGEFIKGLPGKPTLSAFSGTTTMRDARIITGLLDMKISKNQELNGWTVYKNYDFQQNLKPYIVSGGETMEWLYKILDDEKWQRKGYSVIIYCNFAKDADEVYKALKERFKGYSYIKPCKYHGLMDDETRRKRGKQFLDNKYNVIVATKAFGMGIDKDKVGMVINYDMPASVEDYYQAMSRAGRNIKKVPNAKSYILVPEKPLAQFTNWITGDVEEAMDSPIMSRFSYEMRKEIRYTKLLRLATMWALNKRAGRDYNKRAAMVMSYFKNGSIVLPKDNEESPYSQEKIDDHNRIIMEQYKRHLLWEMKEARDNGENIRFNFDLDDMFARASISTLQKVENVLPIIKSVNELHINNTKIANELRWHPSNYELGKERVDWLEPRKSNKADSSNFYEATKYSYLIEGECKPDYFDLCVADAVYSIQLKGENIIYEKTILEILSGNMQATFSRGEQEGIKNNFVNLKTRISNSLDKLMRLKITICTYGTDSKIKKSFSGLFLPIAKRSDLDEKLKGYSWETISPLYEYAEYNHGELIRVNVSDMRVGERISAHNIVRRHYHLHRDSIGNHAFGRVRIKPSTEYEIVAPYMPDYIREKTKKAYKWLLDPKFGGRFLDDRNKVERINILSEGEATWNNTNLVKGSYYKDYKHDQSYNFFLNLKSDIFVEIDKKLWIDNEKNYLSIIKDNMDGILEANKVDLKDCEKSDSLKWLEVLRRDFRDENYLYIDETLFLLWYEKYALCKLPSDIRNLKAHLNGEQGIKEYIKKALCDTELWYYAMQNMNKEQLYDMKKDLYALENGWYYYNNPKCHPDLSTEEIKLLGVINKLKHERLKTLVIVCLAKSGESSEKERITFYRAVENFYRVNYESKNNPRSYLEKEILEMVSKYYHDEISIGDMVAWFVDYTDTER